MYLDRAEDYYVELINADLSLNMYRVNHCDKVYVGKTTQTLRDRVNGHRAKIGSGPIFWCVV